MRRPITLVLVALLLGACAVQRASQPPATVAPIASVAKTLTVPVIRVCPHKTAWSDSQFDALASAMAALPANSPIWDLEKDWQKMRDADDACANAKAE